MTDMNEKQPEGGLLRSREWAGVLRVEGKEVVEFDGGFGVVNRVPYIGKYFYVPRSVERGAWSDGRVERVARENGCAWVRMDVSSGEQLENLRDPSAGRDVGMIRSLALREAPHDMQPREHLILDLSPGADEILANMKSKWRYNIRLAEKKGVVTHYATPADHDFDHVLTAFHELTQKTGAKKGVSFHPREHYAAMFDALPEGMIAIFAAEYDNHVIAANIVTFYNDTATYLHGGTDPEFRNLMAPHLLQWAAIRAAVGRDLKYYDFGGVYSDSSDPGKAGITKFKKGFAPDTETLKMPGSYDIILSSAKYWLYRFLQKLKLLLLS